jgi:hypothetical protein
LIYQPWKLLAIDAKGLSVCAGATAYLSRGNEALYFHGNARPFQRVMRDQMLQPCLHPFCFAL